MDMRWHLIGAALLLGAATAAEAQTAGAEAEIRARLDGWAEAFNRRDAATVCDLFATDVIAVVRGTADAGKAEVCARLETALADTTKDMTYSPEIEEVLVTPSGDGAVVRITWTLGIEKAGAVVTSQERGMDLFRRDPDGVWRIARFIAFSTEPDE